MKILILEDELLIAEDISEMLEELGHDTFAICKSSGEVDKALELGKPDMALLDIRIHGDIDGVEVGKRIHDDHQIPGVFLTSHSDKSIVERALKNNPLGYLVKPIKQGDLFVTLQMAERQIHAMKKSDQPTISLKLNGVARKVNVYEITHLESDNNYTHIYINGEKHTTSKVLKHWLEEIDLSHFVRIHRSYAVNPERIEAIGSTQVELGKIALPIGRKYKTDLEGILKN